MGRALAERIVEWRRSGGIAVRTAAAAAPHRVGLLLLLILVPSLLVVALIFAVGLYVLTTLGPGQNLPAGWPTAGFVVSGNPTSDTRDQVGKMLVARAGGSARYTTRPNGVLIGVPLAEKSALQRIRSLAPIHTDVEFRPVLSTGTSGAASVLPSLDGKNTYQVGPVAMTGVHVSAAESAASSNSPGDWQVTVSLDAAGAKEFDDVTARLVGQELAIVVAGTVVSAPMIQDAITGGQVIVQGKFSHADADGLTAAFQLGQHPVTVNVGNPG